MKKRTKRDHDFKQFKIINDKLDRIDDKLNHLLGKPTTGLETFTMVMLLLSIVACGILNINLSFDKNNQLLKIMGATGANILSPLASVWLGIYFSRNR